MSKRPRDEGSINSIRAILGDIPNETIEILLHRSNNNVEAAINLYFTDPPAQPTSMKQSAVQQQTIVNDNSLSSNGETSQSSSYGIRYYIGDIVVSGALY